jgi:hypothetical protein
MHPVLAAQEEIAWRKFLGRPSASSTSNRYDDFASESPTIERLQMQRIGSLILRPEGSARTRSGSTTPCNPAGATQVLYPNHESS